jgi:hypothetical protein
MIHLMIGPLSHVQQDHHCLIRQIPLMLAQQQVDLEVLLVQNYSKNPFSPQSVAILP